MSPQAFVLKYFAPRNSHSQSLLPKNILSYLDLLVTWINIFERTIWGNIIQLPNVVMRCIMITCEMNFNRANFT